MTLVWQKTSAITLESVPARYLISVKRDTRFKDYEAFDSLGGGYVTARRGVSLKDAGAQSAALASIKSEVEEYDKTFG